MRKAKRPSDVRSFEEIPNVGPSLAKDLRLLGFRHPRELIDQDGIQLYQKLMEKTAMYQDPCVADVFMSAIDFMEGGTPKKWWLFTSLRKERLNKK